MTPSTIQVKGSVRSGCPCSGQYEGLIGMSIYGACLIRFNSLFRFVMVLRLFDILYVGVGLYLFGYRLLDCSRMETLWLFCKDTEYLRNFNWLFCQCSPHGEK